MSTELAAGIEKHFSEEEVVEMCRALVRAPSENPPGDERIVAAVAVELIEKLGLEAETAESAPGRVSVRATWGSGDPVLCFNGHYDVVPVGDPSIWPYPPFDAQVHDGKIWGRGTTDMKAGIASCLAAVATLQRSGFEPSGRLVMHFVADEEAFGSLGTEWLLGQGWYDDVTECVVGEPTAMHLVTAERGGVWMRLTTEGRAAHASRPELGVSAIEHMSRIVQGIYAMRLKGLHPTLGKGSISVGTIRGGSKVNTVADHCEIEIDRRTIPGETQESVIAEIENVIDAVRTEIPNLAAKIEVGTYGEASETPPGTRMVELLSEARDAFGVEGSEVGYMGATDARFVINQAKVPAIIFGPGDLLLAHTIGEHVEISHLVDATRIYAHAFARFLGAD